MTLISKCRSTASGLCLLLAAISLFASTVAAQCIQDLHELQRKEAAVTDVSKPRTYIICPNKVYEIGYLDINQNLRGGDSTAQPPLPLRPNLTLRCGNSGLRSNLCWISDGHVQVDGTAIRGIEDRTVNNVVLEGFTFMGALKHSIWVTKPGSITFRDCEWKDFTRSEGPIMLDYYDSDRNDELLVTFENCLFHDNVYFGMGAQTSLITANSDQNRLKISKSVFADNNMKFNTTTGTTSYLIESLGPTTVEDSCFSNNQVISSSIAVYGSTLSSLRVFSSNSGGNQCAFASVFQTLQQYEKLKPLCVSASKSVCDLLPSGPTPAPVMPAKLSIPFKINALKYDEASDSDAILEGGCNREGSLPVNGPDAQNTDDAVCKQFGGCHVSHTKPGEFLVYKFAHSNMYSVNGFIMVDVTVRMASPTKREFKLELLYDGQMEQQANFFTAGLGTGAFTEISWKNVQLRADETSHALRVSFVNGNINFCAIGVDYSNGGQVPSPAPTLPRTSAPTLPRTSAPTSPRTAAPTLPRTLAPTSPRTSAPTLPRTSAPTLPRTSAPTSPRTSAPTLPRTSAPTSRRTSAPTSPRTSAPTSPRTSAPTLPRTSAPTLPRSSAPTLPRTSAPTLPRTSAPTLPRANVVVVVPGQYNAMSFTNDYLDDDSTRVGNCPFRKDTFVDAKINQDSICLQAISEFAQYCHIGWTKPNEYVVYDFKKQSSKTSVKVTVRVSSVSKRGIQVDLYSSNGGALVATKQIATTGTQSFDVYETLVVWNSITIGNGELYKMKVTFLEGAVNMCSFGIE